MLVFELPLKICFLAPTPFDCVSERMEQLIGSVLYGDAERTERRENDPFASYTFDLPYPLEAKHVYCERKIYTIRIRTVHQELAEFLSRRLPLCGSEWIQIFGGELRVIPRHFLERVHTLTPVVIRTGEGYWRNQMQVEEFAERLKTNLVRKYNFFRHAELPDDFSLFQKMEFTNRKPVRVPRNQIVLLGDKLNLTAARNETAQELLYMALGTGIGENNAQGCGFLGYRFR